VAFKSCSYCRSDWASLDDFMRDPEVRPLGLVIHFRDAYRSLLLFNHRCGTTLALRADELRDRLPPLDGPSLAGQPTCNNLCLRFEELGECDQPCRHAPLRKLLAEMRRERALRSADRARHD
jgi:hypothetical protein